MKLLGIEDIICTLHLRKIQLKILRCFKDIIKKKKSKHLQLLPPRRGCRLRHHPDRAPAIRLGLPHPASARPYIRRSADYPHRRRRHAHGDLPAQFLHGSFRRRDGVRARQ